MAEAKTGNSAALNSWKEIAGYLKIDVRTCQRWEQSLGLPVHRIGYSLRSRVVAYPAEIEEWRKNTMQVRDRQGNGEPALNGNGLRAAINGNGARPKFKLKHLPIFLVPVLAMTAAFLLEPSFDRNPADFRIDGPSLIVLNKHKRTLWTFDTGLEDLLPESFFRKAFPRKELASDGFMVFPNIYLHDLNQDGRNEVLFVPQSESNLGVGKLYFFDSRGKIVWIFVSGREIRIGDVHFTSDFVIDLLEITDVDGDGRPEILVGAHCFQRAPTQITLLSPRKDVLGEYWNYGQIKDCLCRDLNEDGRQEIVLVGTNNEYSQAVLSVLDPNDMKGTSPQGQKFAFAGMREGTAQYYLRFTMTELEKLMEPRGVFMKVRTMLGTRLVAASKWDFIWYEFDTLLAPPQITITDSYINAHREAVQKGLISQPFDPEALKKELAAGVLYYDGESKSWANRRAMANPWPEKK